MLTQKIKKAVQKKDVLWTRILLKDLLVSEMDSTDFKDALAYAEKHLKNLYDFHEDQDEQCKTVKEFLITELNYLSVNFSATRIQNILNACDILRTYGDIPLQQHEKDPMREMKVTIVKNRIGWGSILAGAVSIGAGIIATETAATIGGVAAVIIGGTLVLTNRVPSTKHICV